MSSSLDVAGEEEDHVAQSLTVPRTSLTTAEQWTEKSRQGRAYAAVDREAAAHGFDARVLHKDYRGADAPRRWAVGDSNEMCHVSGSEWTDAWLMIDNRLVFGIDDVGYIRTPSMRRRSWLRQRRHQGTQAPAISITVELADQRKVHFSICGYNLATGDKARSPIQIWTGYSVVIQSAVRAGDMLRDLTLQNHARRGRLVLTELDLISRAAGVPNNKHQQNQIKISGDISSTELQEWIQLAAEASKPESRAPLPAGLDERQLLVAMIASHPQMIIRIFHPFQKFDTEMVRQERPQQAAAAYYFKNAMHCSAVLGQFWFARLQHGIEHGSPDYQFVNADTGRWLVTAWDPDQTSVVPVSWAPWDLPSNLSDVDDNHFLLRMSLHRQSQKMNFDFRALYTEKPVSVRVLQDSSDTRSYIMQCYISLDKTEISQSMLPRLNSYVKAKVTLPNGRTLNIQGETIHSPMTGPVSFVVKFMYESETNTGSITTPQDSRGRAELQFPYNPINLNRQLDALRSLNDDQDAFIDINNLLFATPPNSTILERRQSYIASRTQNGQSQQFLDAILKMGLDDSQELAANAMVTSPTGIVPIVGPPGTGKSATILAIIQAALDTDQKILVCTHAKSNLSNLITNWLDGVGKEEERRIKWTIFTGAFKRGLVKPKKDKKAPKTNPAVLAAEIAKGDSNRIKAGWLQIAVEQKGALDKFERFGLTNRVLAYIRHRAYGLKDVEAQQHEREMEIFDDLSVEQQEEFKARLERLTEMYFEQYCRLVFCTLNMSAETVLVEHYDADCVIVDECGAASSVDAITPLAGNRKSCKTFVCSGDSSQLGPVDNSKDRNEAYAATSRSLLELIDYNQQFIFTDQRIPVYPLDEQYRMHQHISRYPNERIYQGKIKDHKSVLFQTKLSTSLDQVFSVPFESYFGSRQYRIGINVDQSAAKHFDGTTSWCNEREAEEVAKLVAHLLNTSKDSSTTKKIELEDILVITPYDGQRRLIATKLHHAEVHLQPKIMTTINAQGSEAAIVIVSLVKHDPNNPTNVKFINDSKQINVEMTRAKKMLFVLAPFVPWLQAIADGRRGVDYSGFRHIRHLAEDFFNNDQLIDCQDLWTMLVDGKLVARQAGLVPVEFVKQTLPSYHFEEQRAVKRSRDEMEAENGEE